MLIDICTQVIVKITSIYIYVFAPGITVIQSGRQSSGNTAAARSSASKTAATPPSTAAAASAKDILGREVLFVHIIGLPEQRELLVAIEEKHRLISVLNACIDTPEPVFVQIGVKEISEAGEHLALISAPYSSHDMVQGSLGVLGPTRMHYERAMTAVAYVAQMFSEALQKMDS